METLATTLAVQSFVLAIDPFDPSDEGFLGGTTTGREFWRGLRGGGTPGALAFKDYCRRNNDPQASAVLTPFVSVSSTSKSKKTPASLLKSEVYAAVRTALRFATIFPIWFGSPFAHRLLRKASGVRTAEMRWKNQSNLETYGVQLVGWPVSIPMQNPSTLSAAQNTQILNALTEGTMQFLPIGSSGGVPPQADSTHVPDLSSMEETASDMDEYVKYDDFPTSELNGGEAAKNSSLLQVKCQWHTLAGCITLV